MSWVTLTPGRLGELMRFLGPREAYCAAFTERMLAGGRTVIPDPREHRVHVRLNDSGKVNGAILQSISGLYYPVLGEGECRVEPAATEALRRATRRIYSIMGRLSDVRALEEILPRRPVQAVEYHLMVQDEPPPELPLPRLPASMSIHRSSITDADLLFPIQKQYEMEEVLLPGNSFNPVASLNHLREMLRTQVVVHATISGVAVAKAGTNARGLFYDQLGGVFTHRSLRSRGVGTALMLRLLGHLAAERKTATLFVKKDNAAAVRMYRNLRFSVLDEFRISYYR